MANIKTFDLLKTKYNSTPIISIETVVADHFSHLTADKLLRKIQAGDIALPLVRIDPKSQKSAKGIPLIDLARYLDQQIAVARKECDQLNNTDFSH